MARSLNIFLNYISTYFSCCSNIIRWRPKRAIVKLCFQFWKFYKKLPCSNTFKFFYHCCNGNCGRKRQKQMYMVWLNFFRQYLPFIFETNCIYQNVNPRKNIPHQHCFPILRAPYNMVSSLIYTVSFIYYISNVLMVTKLNSKINWNKAFASSPD